MSTLWLPLSLRTHLRLQHYYLKLLIVLNIFLELMMPTVRQIEAFRAVMITRSMTDAARMLSVTQPAVSKIIKELQQGGLEPSSQGKALYAEVDRLFGGMERVARAADRIRQRHFGQLKIAAMSSITSYFMAKVVRAFRKKHPNVSVSIETYNSPEVVDLVTTGFCDLGYAVTPVSSDAVTVRRLFRTKLVCILPRNHRLAKRRTIDFRDLSGEDFVSLLNWNTTRLAVDTAFRTANVRRCMTLEAGWSATASALVAEGLGVAMIDPFTAELSASCGCVVRPLTQTIEFCFVEMSPKISADNELAEEFSEAFRRAFRAYALDA
jgi:DNA-binding transcriptional LysR family regulator